MGGLSPRDRLVLGGGMAAVLLIVALGRGIPAWHRWDADTRAAAGELIGEAQAAEASAAGLAAALDSLQARRARFVELGGAVLAGGSPAAAGAALAGLVSRAAGRAGAQLGSVQVLPDTSGAGIFLRVTVRGDATGDLPSVTRMLAMFEGDPHRLILRELSITQPNPGGPAELPETLRVEFAVQGLALRPGVEGPPVGRTKPADSLSLNAVPTLPPVPPPGLGRPDRAIQETRQ
jgi:hypothetical protein